MSSVKVFVAGAAHANYGHEICQLIEEAAKLRKTGIAKRKVSHIIERINSGHAIIAISGTQLAGFCYIASWQNDEFVSHSSLIVHPAFRGLGLAKKIKETAMDLSHRRYPGSKVFGITTSSAVMKINHTLGYLPVAYRDLPDDENFWAGCRGCPNHDILLRNKREMCLCTGMLAQSSESMAFDLSDLVLNASAYEK